MREPGDPVSRDASGPACNGHGGRFKRSEPWVRSRMTARLLTGAVARACALAGCGAPTERSTRAHRGNGAADGCRAAPARWA